MDSSLEDTKREFEKSFQEATFYNRQTQDEQHKEMLLNSLHIFGEYKVLDLGTGSGYLAFELARRRKDCMITGLDILEETLIANQRKANEEKLDNLRFVTYDGKELPFENNTFDVVITRYAFHHFPEIQDSFHEIYRILKPGGQLLLADPTPNEFDEERFIDRYMKVKKDGHIKFYTKEEFETFASRSGLIFEASVKTKIRFPRKKNPEIVFLLEETSEKIKELYQIEECEDEVYISQDVINLSFFKG